MTTTMRRAVRTFLAWSAFLLASCQSVPTGTGSPQVAPSSIDTRVPGPTSTQAAPTPTGVPTMHGVPMTVDGEDVAMADALRAEIKVRSDGASFLAGGWFRTHVQGGRYCAVDFLPEGMNLCLYGFELYDARTGPWLVEIARGRLVPAALNDTLP
jgi:hypothetical protein